MSSPTSSTAATATDALWGSTPIKTFIRTNLRFGRISVVIGVKDIPTSGGAPTPLLSHSTRRSLRREAGREQANPSYGRQEVHERSLYNRRPRSLAALETTELLTRVKQVGSSYAASCIAPPQSGVEGRLYRSVSID